LGDDGGETVALFRESLRVGGTAAAAAPAGAMRKNPMGRPLLSE